MKDEKLELLELLAYIDLDLEEIENDEEKALKELAKPYKAILRRMDKIEQVVEVELDKIEPNLGKLELLRNEYLDLIYQRYELDKQYLISSETIATIDLEELEEE